MAAAWSGIRNTTDNSDLRILPGSPTTAFHKRHSSLFHLTDIFRKARRRSMPLSQQLADEALRRTADRRR